LFDLGLVLVSVPEAAFVARVPWTLAFFDQWVWLWLFASRTAATTDFIALRFYRQTPLLDRFLKFDG